MQSYVPGRLTPNTKSVTVKSGFGLCKNEANLDQSRNSINTAHTLANQWTETSQGMSKFPMNRKDMGSTHMSVNEPQIQGVYPNTVGITSKNRKGG